MFRKYLNFFLVLLSDKSPLCREIVLQLDDPPCIESDWSDIPTNVLQATSICVHLVEDFSDVWLDTVVSFCIRKIFNSSVSCCSSNMTRFWQCETLNKNDWFQNSFLSSTLKAVWTNQSMWALNQKFVKPVSSNQLSWIALMIRCINGSIRQFQRRQLLKLQGRFLVKRNQFLWWSWSACKIKNANGPYSLRQHQHRRHRHVKVPWEQPSESNMVRR